MVQNGNKHATKIKKAANQWHYLKKLYTAIVSVAASMTKNNDNKMTKNDNIYRGDNDKH